MYKQIIHQSLQACLENKATFPAHVQTIAKVCVVRYEVDLLQGKVTYHLTDNTTHVEEIPVIKSQTDNSRP